MTKRILPFIIILTFILTPFWGLQAQSDMDADAPDGPETQIQEQETILDEGVGKRAWTKTKQISKDVYEAIEVWRVNTLEMVTENKEKAKYAVEEGERRPVEEIIEEGNLERDENIFKPWEYVKLSFFTGSEAVLKTKFVFYGILIMIVLTILMRVFK